VPVSSVLKEDQINELVNQIIFVKEYMSIVLALFYFNRLPYFSIAVSDTDCYL
jgi:hypothetical protein